MDQVKSKFVTRQQKSDLQKKKPVDDLKVIEEIDGPKGPEPTRYGDWEKNGRCSDF